MCEKEEEEEPRMEIDDGGLVGGSELREPDRLPVTLNLSFRKRRRGISSACTPERLCLPWDV